MPPTISHCYGPSQNENANTHISFTQMQPFFFVERKTLFKRYLNTYTSAIITHDYISSFAIHDAFENLEFFDLLFYNQLKLIGRVRDKTQKRRKKTLIPMCGSSSLLWFNSYLSPLHGIFIPTHMHTAAYTLIKRYRLFVVVGKIWYKNRRV